MSTGAFSPDAGDIVTRSGIPHVVEADVVLPDGTTYPLDVVDAATTWDATRAPRVTATVTARLIEDQAVLDDLDPRTGLRLRLRAGYRRPDGFDDVQPIADLGVRSRDVTRRGGTGGDPTTTLTFTAASDEALFMDGAPAGSVTISSASVAAAIQAVVAQQFTPTWSVNVTSSGAAVSSTTDDCDRWELVNDLKDRIGATLYVDEDRVWHLEDQPTLAATPDHTLAVGQTGTVLSSDSRCDREQTGADGFYNRVYLVYRWNDGTTDQVVKAVRSVTTGPYAATGTNMRTYRIERRVAVTQAFADVAAEWLVRRTVSRGRSFNLEAIAAYWLRPGMTVSVQLPLGEAQLHLVESVTFDHRAGTMRVTTRLPDNTGTIA